MPYVWRNANRKTALATLFASAVLLTSRSLWATTYSITDLETLGGTASHAFGVNIHGDVVGSSITSSGAEHAFLYHNGSMTDLGVLVSGDTGSQAFGINDAGAIVGQWVGTNSNPFIYSGGQMSLVGSLGGTNGLATRINNAGQVVGTSAKPTASRMLSKPAVVR